MSSRYRTKLRLLVITVLLCTLLGVSTQIPLTRADWELGASGSIERDIGGYSWRGHWWSGLTTNNKLRFVWSSGFGLDFLIMNQDNYNLWSSGYTANCEVIRESLISDNYGWVIPRNGEVWYAIWRNDGFFSTHLSCNWYRYIWVEPYTPPNTPGLFPSYMPLIQLLVAISVIFIIIAVVAVIVKRTTQGPKETPSPQTRMCPKCNAPLASDDTYCGECGLKV